MCVLIILYTLLPFGALLGAPYRVGPGVNALVAPPLSAALDQLTSSLWPLCSKPDSHQHLVVTVLVHPDCAGISYSEVPSGEWKCLSCCFKHCCSVRILHHIPRGHALLLHQHLQRLSMIVFQVALLLVEAASCVLGNPVSSGGINWGLSLATSIKCNATCFASRILIPRFLAFPLSFVLHLAFKPSIL